MKLVLYRLPSVRGNVRMPYLAPEAAISLLSLEKDTEGLVYVDMFRDQTASLLERRTKKGSHLPGYSAHNYGLAVDLDVGIILSEKKIRYEQLIHIMKKRGWYCRRKDGDSRQPGSEHFAFLGEDAPKYLERVTQDPATWDLPEELRIYDKHGKDFMLKPEEIQEKLAKLCLYAGPPNGQMDSYFREAVLAFQRAFDLTQTGMADMTTCRVLAYVTADRELEAVPAWVVSAGL